MPEYESTYYVYRSSHNERLNDAKTCALPAAVYLFFLLKRGDDLASRPWQNVKAEFAVPSDVPSYLEVERYNEVKYRVESNELRMEFHLKIMKLFYRAGENFVGIHSSSKCLLAAKVCHFLGTASSQSYIILDSRIWWFPL